MSIGVDVASIDRVTALVERNSRFTTRTFTEQEQIDCARQPQRWATRWAAKEAVRKLWRGHRRPAFRDIEVVLGKEGQPYVYVGGYPTSIALSLSHDHGMAIAVAIGDINIVTATRDLQPVVLPARPDDAHKGTFGTVHVVGGSLHFSGAPYLTAMGAARSGAGLVRAYVPQRIYDAVAAKCAEVMVLPLPDDNLGVLTESALDILPGKSESHVDAVVVGPGLGQHELTREAVTTYLSRGGLHALIVDADALTIAGDANIVWKRCAQTVVLTPHPGEMASLLQTSIAEVQSDRVKTASTFAQEHGVVVVLKGSQTVVAAPDGRVHIDSHRVVALATGGTGDVLAGVIGAMLAQGLNGFDAAVTGVTLHSVAGVIVQETRGRAGGLASDLLNELPRVHEEIRQQQSRLAEV